MSDVKRFWADLCVHHVEAVLYSDYAALEAELVMRTNERNGLRVSLDTTVLQVEALQAELARLRAGQEPVAFAVFDGPWIEDHTADKNRAEQWAEDGREVVSLYTTPQPSAVPDGWRLVPVEPTPEMVSAAEEAHMPFGDMDIALRMAILSAPSAPATVQGDADNYRWLRDQHNNVNSDIGVYDGANILATQEGELDLDAAIAAARQEGGEV